MGIRRKLLDLILEIARRDKLDYHAIARTCRTSGPRAFKLLKGQIDLFNSETLMDILARLGVDVDVTVVRRRPYTTWNLDNPRPGWKPPPGFAHG